MYSFLLCVFWIFCLSGFFKCSVWILFFFFLIFIKVLYLVVASYCRVTADAQKFPCEPRNLRNCKNSQTLKWNKYTKFKSAIQKRGQKKEYITWGKRESVVWYDLKWLDIAREEWRSTKASCFGLFLEAFQEDLAVCNQGIWKFWQSIHKMAGWQSKGCTIWLLHLPTMKAVALFLM